jgi:signal peptidase II
MFLLVMLTGLGLDLASKEWSFRRLGMPNPEIPEERIERIWLVPGALSLHTSLNEGALFGMGAGWGVLFIGLSFVALVGIGYWVWRGGAAADGLLCFALGLVTGGILGNLYDRLGLPGLVWTAELKRANPNLIGTPVYAVRDFIHAKYARYEWADWPIFNLADSFLVCGVALLIFHAYVWEPRRKKAEEKAGDHSLTQQPVTRS